MPPTELPTIDELAVEGRRVLLRADLNVPLAAGPRGAPCVADDARLLAAVPTIQELRARGAASVLVSHLGRPHGRDPRLSLRPVAERLQALTAARVTLAPGVVGPEVRALSARLQPGDILLLENVRFEPGETQNDPALADALAELADVYVDDAFATAHRAHASTVGVAQRLPAAAGRLRAHELSVLGELTEHPVRPLVAVLGGAKVADKLEVVRRFLQTADVICVGGALAMPLLAATGRRIGDSPATEDDLRAATEIHRAAGEAHCDLVLPEDLVIAGPQGRTATTGVPSVPSEWAAVDIGPRTALRFAEELARAHTAFWNGPVGRFERVRFAGGTAMVCRALCSAAATTVVGGGETVEALGTFADPTRITHVSTGGGAMLAMLGGAPLPAVEALRERAAAV